MLVSISIRNIILIRSLDIDLSKGLCVLTGETGAGKSILLDALGFVLGKRSNTTLLRAGEEKGSVTAIFDISSYDNIKQIIRDNDIFEGDELILRRTIDSNNKSKAFINDRVVTVGLLNEIGNYLIEIHGQHEQFGILDNKNNRIILDQYGNISDEIEQVAKSYEEYNKAKQYLEELVKNNDKILQEKSYIEYSCRELEKLDFSFSEQELVEKRTFLMNREKISKIIRDSLVSLDQGSIISILSKIQLDLTKIENVESSIVSINDAINRAIIEINEAESYLSKLALKYSRQDESLEKIENILFDLRAVSRKYNLGIDELKDYLNLQYSKLETIENYDNLLVEANKTLEAKRGNYLELSTILTNKRISVAKDLEDKITKELSDLKMAGTVFKVNFEQLDESNWGKFGRDKINFMASTNIGMPLSPLAKIASGGELSRFLLAVKVVLAKIRLTPTIIFDEIDTAIGGATADAVGKRLKLLGDNVQVIAITHQPQVASKGDLHLHISKVQSNNATETIVKILENLERTEEIARMLAGEIITSQARAAAEMLLVK